MSNTNNLSGSEIKSLMRRHGETIATVSARMGVTLKRVREVRDEGVSGYLFVCDWYQGITGVDMYAQRLQQEGFNL